MTMLPSCQTIVRQSDSTSDSPTVPTVPTVVQQWCHQPFFLQHHTTHTHSTACVQPATLDAGTKMDNAQSMQRLTVATTIADGKTRCAAQNLKLHFSLLHSILRQTYRVERFPEGSPTSSLCNLQVSEAECQGIKTYACFSA